jgi:hypothetical protein
VFQKIGVGFRKHGLNALLGAPDHDHNPQLYSTAVSVWKQSSENVAEGGQFAYVRVVESVAILARAR